MVIHFATRTPVPPPRLHLFHPAAPRRPPSCDSTTQQRRRLWVYGAPLYPLPASISALRPLRDSLLVAAQESFGPRAYSERLKMAAVAARVHLWHPPVPPSSLHSSPTDTPRQSSESGVARQRRWLLWLSGALPCALPASLHPLRSPPVILRVAAQQGGGPTTNSESLKTAAAPAAVALSRSPLPPPCLHAIPPATPRQPTRSSSTTWRR